MRVFVEGVGVVGPGLEGWQAARDVLAGIAPYEPAPVRVPPVSLPQAERRRAGMTVRLAITAGVEALAQAGRNPAEMAIVFAASGGDGDTIHDMLATLATPQRAVSPTRFHNSVHNAPAGYWAVATGSHMPSTSLSAFDDSFAAGLLEAAVQSCMEERPVTLVAYDVPYPEPLNTARPIAAPFGMALVLTPQQTSRSLVALTLVTRDKVLCPSGMANAGLEQLRRGNPAARGLPLLAAIARSDSGAVCVGSIGIAVTPTC